jgi:hypothetical protein
MTESSEKEPTGIIINEVQLLLAEKRTSLASMRTGIAVFALPLSVLSVLVATSKYYDFIHVIHFMIPLLIICTAMVFLGSYLIIRSVTRIHHYDKLILEIKRKNSQIAEFLD